MAGSPGGLGPPDPGEADLAAQEPPAPGAAWTRTVTTAGTGTTASLPPPDGAGPDGAGPDGAGPGGAGPDGAGPDGAGPDGAGPDGAGPDGVRAGHAGLVQQVFRYGPGVPVPGHPAQAAPTAAQVWRAGLPGAVRPPRRLRRLAGLALSVALLAASGAVIYLRLQHGPFGVTGVVITGQSKHGCTQDVNGRVSTTGAAGTVSYEWVFTPGLAAPRPLSESVARGQSALYVTAAVAGQGHGSLTQTVTLRVLGPGRGSASAQVALRC
jgi:hypothetical protein